MWIEEVDSTLPGEDLFSIKILEGQREIRSVGAFLKEREKELTSGQQW